MNFRDQKMTVKIGNRDRSVTVTGDALHVLWGECSGPQTAEALVLANRDMFEEIARLKAKEQPGRIVIDEIDVEDGPAPSLIGVSDEPFEVSPSAIEDDEDL